MAKISKKTIENMCDILDRGCEYAATQDVVNEIANKVLEEAGCELCQCEDVTIIDWNGETVCTLDEYANMFWDAAVEKFLNILSTEE